MRFPIKKNILLLVCLVVFLFGFFGFFKTIKAQSIFPEYKYNECIDANLESVAMNEYVGGYNCEDLRCAQPLSQYLCCKQKSGGSEKLVCIDRNTGEGTLPPFPWSAPTKVTKKTTIYFKPNITIPGSRFIAGRDVPITGDTLGQWISLFFMFFCGAVAIFAAVNIIFGGFKYLTSFGNATRMASAKDRITSAIIGLILTLGAYIILVTVSPQLVNFNSLSIFEKKGILPIKQEIYAEGTENSEDYGKGQECFYKTYGLSEKEMADNLVDINFQGHTVKVHKLALNAFQKVNDAITKANLGYSFISVFTYNWREAVGVSEKKTSLHSWGIAIDINGSTNPYCPYQWNTYSNLSSEQKEKCKNGERVTDIPDAVVNIFQANCFKWGGAWDTSKDSMHFEWHQNCYNKCP